MWVENDCLYYCFLLFCPLHHAAALSQPYLQFPALCAILRRTPRRIDCTSHMRIPHIFTLPLFADPFIPCFRDT